MQKRGDPAFFAFHHSFRPLKIEVFFLSFFLPRRKMPIERFHFCVKHKPSKKLLDCLERSTSFFFFLWAFRVSLILSHRVVVCMLDYYFSSHLLVVGKEGGPLKMSQIFFGIQAEMRERKRRIRLYGAASPRQERKWLHPHRTVMEDERTKGFLNS